jgi:hypothetical protein
MIAVSHPASLNLAGNDHHRLPPAVRWPAGFKGLRGGLLAPGLQWSPPMRELRQLAIRSLGVKAART